MRFLAILGLLSFSLELLAASVLSGPMPGAANLREIILWLQTDEAAQVQVRYWPQGATDNPQLSEVITTESHRAFTAEPILVNLEPGTTYEYRILLDGVEQPQQYQQTVATQPLWHWREDPPAFTFALGSCNFVNEARYDRPGDPFGDGYEIFESIADQQPDFMLWLGDNVYYREVDWNAVSSMYSRYSHTRQLPEMQRLLTQTHHYAIWDDHDFGSNDADRSFHLSEPAVEVFNDFWPNPTSNLTGKGGITSYFEWHDVSFFLLDNRYFRSANYRVTGERTVLGEAQIEWLIDTLRTNRASFKFIVMGGQFISSAEVFENYINLAPGERRQILDRLKAENIPGVIFLTGDRHHSELMKMDRNGTYPLYEWTVSPLTGRPYPPLAFEQQYRIQDSLYSERNFGTMKVSGPWDNRLLDLQIHNTAGDVVWRYQIKQSELQ